MTDEFLLPNEPTRFTHQELDRALIHCKKLEASDITFQSNKPIYAEIYGHLRPVTRRNLASSEIGDMLNSIYGPNGTTQIASGIDVDTNYSIKPTRYEHFRFRVNGTGCQVEGHDGLQLTLRTIPGLPPDIESMNLEPELVKNIAPQQGVVFVTGGTGSGK